MGTRLELQSKLEELLGARHVYWEPPETLKMEYPAIVYSRTKIRIDKADNVNYRSINKYEIIVISRKPDSPVIEKILNLFYSSHDNHYVSENLHHDVFTLYF